MDKFLIPVRTNAGRYDSSRSVRFFAVGAGLRADERQSVPRTSVRTDERQSVPTNVRLYRLPSSPYRRTSALDSNRCDQSGSGDGQREPGHEVAYPVIDRPFFDEAQIRDQQIIFEQG